jgi:hypothetical protein
VIDRQLFFFKECPMKRFTFAVSAVALLLAAGFAYAQGGQMQGQKIGLAVDRERRTRNARTRVGTEN